MPPYPKRNLFLLTSQFTRGAVASHGQVFWLGHHRCAPPSQFPSGIWRALRPYSDEFAQASHLFPFSAEPHLYAPGHPRPYSVFYRHHTIAAVFPSTGGRPLQKRKQPKGCFLPLHFVCPAQSLQNILKVFGQRRREFHALPCARMYKGELSRVQHLPPGTKGRLLS